MVKVAPWALSAAPFMALAQGLSSGDTTKVKNIFDAAGDIIQWVVVLIIALAVVFFLLNLLKLLRSSGDDRTKARNDMIWGIVIIVVMVSVWGLVEWVQDIFGFGSGADYQIPDVPTVSNVLTH